MTLFKYAIRHKTQNRLMEWSKAHFDIGYFLDLDLGGPIWFTDTEQAAEDTITQKEDLLRENGRRGPFNAPKLGRLVKPSDLEVVKISIKCD